MKACPMVRWAATDLNPNVAWGALEFDAPWYHLAPRRQGPERTNRGGKAWKSAPQSVLSTVTVSINPEVTFKPRAWPTL